MASKGRYWSEHLRGVKKKVGGSGGRLVERKGVLGGGAEQKGRAKGEIQ